jgi:hypothetical protein
MKRLLLLAAIIPAILLAACGDDEESSDNGDSSNGGGSDVTAEPTPTPGPETPVPDVCGPNPAPGTLETIVIEQPTPLSKHTRSLTVTGQIAAFEATFKVRIYDANGGVLVGATGMSAEGQMLSPFSQEVNLSVAEEMPACLWVYEESARDGSPTNVAQVPISVSPGAPNTPSPAP